jgi:hypothetical protein
VSARRQGEGGKSGWRGSLPHYGAPAAACGEEEAAVRRAAEARLGNGGGGGEASGARVSQRRRRLRLGGEALGHGGLNRVARRLGVRARNSARRGSAGPRSDSGSSPSWSRGRSRQAGTTRQRENGGERRRQAARGKVGRGKLLGRAEGKEKRRRKEGRGLGCAGGERESGPSQLGRAGGEERPAWAGLQGRKRKEKGNRESGPGPIRKREIKRNAFKCI